MFISPPRVFASAATAPPPAALHLDHCILSTRASAHALSAVHVRVCLCLVQTARLGHSWVHCSCHWAQRVQCSCKRVHARCAGRRSAHWTVRTGLASEGAGAAASSDPIHHPMIVSRSDAAKQLACCMPCTFRLTQECQQLLFFIATSTCTGGMVAFEMVAFGRHAQAIIIICGHPFLLSQTDRQFRLSIRPDKFSCRIVCLFFCLFMKQKTKQI